MPSAKTHDLVTVLLAPPVALFAYYFTGDWAVTVIATSTMIFGGLMFGPDLDIQSRQYTRWGPFRFLWWPYKVILPHRSWLSHSILFGTLIRVVYFLAVITLLTALALYVRDVYMNDHEWGATEVKGAFSRVWEILAPIRRSYLVAAFVGLWVGASSHTVTDVLGSFFKSVRKSI
jgi:uncharacterized metal-binding protein